MTGNRGKMCMLLMILLSPIFCAMCWAQPAPAKMRVLVMPYLGYAPFFIAQEEGYFAEQGLIVEFVNMRRSSLALPLLIKGELDVMGGTNSFSIYNAMTRGAAIKIVASRGINLDPDCPYTATMVRKNLGFSMQTLTAEDIRGKRVGINPKSSEAFLFERFLERYGLSLKDMQIVDVPNTLLTEAFKNGAVDFSRAGEPWITRLVQAGSAEVLLPDCNLAAEYDQGIILFGERLLLQDPDLGVRFMKAYIKALTAFEQGKTDRNIEIISKYTKLDSDFLNAACWPAMEPGSGISVESVSAFLRWGDVEGHLEPGTGAGGVLGSYLYPEGGGGLICDNERELGVALDILVKSAGYRSESGRRGKQAFMQKWTSGVYMDGYLDLIDRMANGKKQV